MASHISEEQYQSGGVKAVWRATAVLSVITVVEVVVALTLGTSFAILVELILRNCQYSKAFFIVGEFMQS